MEFSKKMSFIMIATIFLNNFSLLPNLKYSNIFNKYLNEVNQNEMINRVAKALNDYKLALYFDDVKDWSDPDLVQKRALQEIKVAVWNLQEKQNIFKPEDKVDILKIIAVGGYKLDFKQKLFSFEIKYSNSKSATVNFSIWKATRIKVMNMINEKISNISKIDYYERDWESFSYIESIGIKYHNDILSAIGDKILIDNEEVIINKKDIIFYGWDISEMKTKQSVIIRYRYLNYINNYVNLKINLVNKPNITKIMRETILPFLIKNNYLNFNLNQNLDYENITKINEIINTVKDKFLPYIKTALALIEFNDFNWQLNIKKISPIGPFSNVFTIYLQINNSSELIPVKLFFNNVFDYQKVKLLSESINNKLEKFSLIREWTKRATNENLIKLISKNTNNKIIWEDKEVNFDFNQVKIVSREEYNIDNEWFLKLELNIENINKSIFIKINLI